MSEEISDEEADVDEFWSDKEDSGWSQPADHRFQDKNITNKIILIANKAVSLISILKAKKIEFTVCPSPSGWTHKARCPFPDHNDSSPSFSYNSKDDRFYCFGCTRSGQAVQFLSFYERKLFIDVAKQILSQKVNFETLVDEIDFDRITKTDELLNSFAVSISDFLDKNRENPKALKFTESITLSLDLYINKNYRADTIHVEELSARITKLLAYLKFFKNDSNTNHT